MRTPLLCSALALFLFAPELDAQEKTTPWYLDFGLGGVIESDQNVPLLGSVSYDLGYNFNLGLGYYLDREGRWKWAVEVEGLYNDIGFDDQNLSIPTADTGTRVYGLMFNGTGDYYFTKQFALYFGGGIGWAPDIEVDFFDQVGGTYDQSAFAYQLLLGFRYNLGGMYDAILGYRYFATDTLSVSLPQLSGTGQYDIQQHVFEVGVRFGL